MTINYSKGNPIYGQHDEKTLEQFNDVLSRAEKGVLCADGHLGYIQPIGGVIAYKNKVSPIGVGFDIGCGNMAVKLNCKSENFKTSEVLDIVENRISFGVGQTNPDSPRDHELFEDEKWDAYPEKFRSELKRIASDQLGTVGSGNHYVDFFQDEEGNAWIGVHFGSRGLGHKTCTGFLNLSVNNDWETRAKEQEVLLDLNMQLGKDYYAAMKLAGQYAYAGREWVCHTIAKELNADIIETIHNHHNYAWEEKHGDEEYIVVRKGATPAFPGQKGFIGGSMGDDAVIVEGMESEESKSALYSTVHGAGRVMSRTKAGGKYRGWGKKRRKVAEGQISKEMLTTWLSEKEVTLRGGGLDEAPQAYRRLTEVLEYHKNTIKILHTLKPLGVVMAGENEFDPYKD